MECSMTKIKIEDLEVFDPAEHLSNDESIAAFLTDALQERDPRWFPVALGHVARARGMTEIAQASGITREALYKALREGSSPRFDTLSRVCTALGVQLV